MAVTYTSTGVLFFLLALPLVKRRVPMNRLYGFRIRAALESPDRWYEVNEYGGRLMARWSWLVVAVGIAGWFVPGDRFLAYTTVAAVALLLTALAPVVMVTARTRTPKVG